QFDDAGIAAGPRREPLSDFGEQLGGDGLVFDPALHEAAGMQIPPARERDEALRERAQLLGLRFGGLDPAVLKQARGHVVQRRLLVARRARELAAFGAVTHYSSSPTVSWACGATPSSRIRTSPLGVSSSCIPKFSPSRRSSSAISPSAFSPTFFTLSRSSSLYCTRSPRVRMLEFLSELIDRTDRPASSIARASTSRKCPACVPPLPVGSAAIIGT